MLEQNMKFNKEIVSMKKNQTEMSELKIQQRVSTTEV